MIRKGAVLLPLVFAWCASVAAGEMRLMSYNIGHGAGFAGGATNLSVAAEEIRRANPDFVGLQDVDWHCVRSGRLDQAVELGRLAGFHVTFSMACFIGGTCEQQHGVALLSHERPLAKHETVLPGREGKVLLVCEFTDCFVGVTEFDADASHRAESEAIVARCVADLSRRKPVYLVDETGGQTSGRSAVRTIKTPVPDLSRPVVIPCPSETHLAEGTYALAKMEVGEADVRLSADASIPSEGYRIDIAADGISVASSSPAGTFYALATLRQLGLPHWGRLYFPLGTISDAPRFGWRGLMLDESRHFFGKAAVMRILDRMAAHKLNVFQWHLTDNEGWRLPVARYPEIQAKGSTRPCWKGSNSGHDRFVDCTYGPYGYTEDDIREIVACAARRHVRIVPEVDFPGHSEAVLKAFPELICRADGKDAPKGAVKNVFCLGNGRSLEVMKDVLDTVCRLFPDSKYVHIGGDEVNPINWNACPLCRAKMREVGAADAAGLQAWLTAQLVAHLASRGRKAVGWDEIIHDGTVPEGATVMSWRGAEGGIAAAKAGRDSIMCPHRDCYFNYPQGLRDDPVIYPWWGYPLSLERAYAYDPLAGIPEEQRFRVRGGQCCLWANYICDEMQLEWQMWPRACATAEVFWSARKPGFADFRRRMEFHRRRLIGQHVNCAPLD